MPRLLGLVLVCLALATIWRTWGRWGDIQIDFGREVYLAWRLSQGDVLYRDVASFNGPLSPYFNALLFLVFPPSLNTLLAANVIILTATLLCLWKLVRTVAPPTTALAALAFFLATTGLNAANALANYNSLAPYSHEATHGLLLLFLGTLALTRFVRSPGGPFAACCGGLIGLALLTKPEIALAAAGGLGTGVALSIRMSGRTLAGQGRLGAWLTAGILTPPVLALAALSLAMPLSEAARHLVFMWRMLAMPAVTGLRFYEEVTGMAHPGNGLAGMGWSLAVNAGIAAYVACLAMTRPILGRLPSILADGLPVLLLLATYALLDPPDQFLLIALLPRCWPLLLPLTALTLALRLWRTGEAGRVAMLPSLAFCLAAWILTAKITLNATFFHYGAFLLAPAGMAWTTGLAGFFPRLFPNATKRRTATACAVAACLALPCPLLRITEVNLWHHATPVASSRGTMFTDRRGEVVATGLETLRSLARPGETLAVLPEGVMLNFLSGLANSTPYITLMPPEWLAFGEDRIEAAFRDHPPDWVVLLHRNTQEYGYGFFCQDYGQSLCRFFQDNYRQEALFGAMPLRNDFFGLLMLRRNVSTTTEAP